MIKQIDLSTALDKVLNGERVKCLSPCGDPGEWCEMSTGYLNDLLDGVLCFADVEDEPEPEPEPGPDPDPDPDPEPDPPQPRHSTRKLNLDIGKIMALHNAGWSNGKIADEMGVSVSSIQRVMAGKKRLEEEEYGGIIEERNLQDL